MPKPARLQPLPRAQHPAPHTTVKSEDRMVVLTFHSKAFSNMVAPLLQCLHSPISKALKGTKHFISSMSSSMYLHSLCSSPPAVPSPPPCPHGPFLSAPLDLLTQLGVSPPSRVSPATWERWDSPAQTPGGAFLSDPVGARHLIKYTLQNS